MAPLLSKLHVRFIQTQKHFLLQRSADSTNETLPLQQLYVKSNDSFYFINLTDDIDDGSTVSFVFKEGNDYLSSLRCTLKVTCIDKGSDDYEEALLFFHVDASAVRQLLLLTIETIDAK